MVGPVVARRWWVQWWPEGGGFEARNGDFEARIGDFRPETVILRPEMGVFGQKRWF